MKLLPVALIASVLAFAGSVSPAAAITVYQWTDTDGGVHFSDSPPTGPVESLDKKELETSPTTAPPDDHYSIAKQTERMAERRKQRQLLKLEQQRLALEKDILEKDILEKDSMADEAKTRDEQRQTEDEDYYGGTTSASYILPYPAYRAFPRRPPFDDPYGRVTPLYPRHIPMQQPQRPSMAVGNGPSKD